MKCKCLNIKVVFLILLNLIANYKKSKVKKKKNHCSGVSLLRDKFFEKLHTKLLMQFVQKNWIENIFQNKNI